MSNPPWSRALSGAPVETPTLIAAVSALIAPVHRLAWSGEDQHGDRQRALQALLQLLGELRGAHPPIASVVDWWLVAAIGERSASTAWDIERQIPGATGETLREVLSVKGERPLEVLRRPLRFAEVLDRLEAIASTHAGKIAPAVRILKQANSECNAVVIAGREGKARPKDLRLANLSENALLAWASEEEGGRRVDVGTPVWGQVTRGLRDRANLVEEALRLWTPKPAPTIGLPTTWEEDLEQACAPYEEVATTLVTDLLAVPPSRALLRFDRARYLEPPPLEARWIVYSAAREAYAGAAEHPPAWMRECAKELDALGDEIARLRQLARGAAAEHAGFVEEAAKALGRLEVATANDWLATARDEIGKATEDASLERRRAAMRERIAELTDIGERAPPEHVDLDRLESEVSAALSEARKKLQQRIDEVANRLALYRRGAGEDVDVFSGRLAVSKGQLRFAHDALGRAETRAAEAMGADDAHLGPELASLRDRLARRPDRVALLEVLDVAAARREAGLDTTNVLRDLDQLLGSPVPSAVAVEDLGAREVRRIAFVPGGSRASGVEHRTGTRIRGVLVAGPSDAVARVRAWGEAAREPAADFDEGRFYALEDGRVVGPYVVEGDYLVPEHTWQAVADMPVPRFRALFGGVDIPGARFLVPYPPSLEEMLAAGASPRDELDQDRLAAWIAQELDGAPPPEKVARWLKDAEALVIPPELRAARFARMEQILGRSTHLHELRERAVAGYLASDGGQAAISSAAEAVARQDEARIRELVVARQAALQSEIEGLEARRARLADQIAEEERAARVGLESVRRDLADAEALLEDRKLALLARFAGAGAVETGAPSTRRTVSEPLRASPFDYAPIPSLPELVKVVAQGTWGEEEVANLLVSVLTGRWTLLAGLPGVGKSTFVRSVLARLGHGPGSGRFLELVVRRDWQDDTPLFGFWHPTHHAWEPSSEGFVEHLLRAGDDHARGFDGLYPVLVEELNLASPEYYLARPISALEAAQPTVRLYDPELAPANASRYPATFAIPDAVRLLATVNVDDTVERLSPRFLSRASVLWVEPQPDGPTWRAEDDVPRLVVRWDELAAAAAGPPGELGDVEKLLRFLVDRRVPGGPTARTRAAMARYLGSARGLIDRKRAEDLQILQRVLPPLRGVGPRWRTLLDELATLLARNGWAQSAARTRDLRERGEELGDWYDFFHT